MGDYVLITFYNRQTTENPSWEVYGHLSPGINNLLMSFLLREHAIMYAHTFCGVLVLEGANKDHVVEALTPK